MVNLCEADDSHRKRNFLFAHVYVLCQSTVHQQWRGLQPIVVGASEDSKTEKTGKNLCLLVAVFTKIGIRCHLLTVAGDAVKFVVRRN